MIEGIGGPTGSQDVDRSTVLGVGGRANYTNPLWSFRKRPARYIIDTDGSRSEVGLTLFELANHGEVCLGGGAADLAQFGLERTQI
jgi:hypothetical protein